MALVGITPKGVMTGVADVTTLGLNVLLIQRRVRVEGEGNIVVHFRTGSNDMRNGVVRQKVRLHFYGGGDGRYIRLSALIRDNRLLQVGHISNCRHFVDGMHV